MITKTKVNNYISNYCKKHDITRKKYALYPVYIHLNGFSHSIGFTSRKPRKNERVENYNSVGYSAYTGGDTWGELNEHQRNIALIILGVEPHYCYQNNAKEILF